MKRLLPRFIVASVLCLCMMGALIFKLGSLTLAEGKVYEDVAENRSTRTTILKGTRGRILDRNGIVLAYDETCYNVQFQRDPDNRTEYYSAKYTESLIKAIKIIEAGGGTTINTSYIQMNDEGELYYDWGVEDEEVQKKRYYNFCSAMGFYVTEEIVNDKSKWKPAESAYLDMCKSWYIPPEMPFSEAVKIISIRQEANLNNYRAYEPITIAYNVSVEVVSQLEMRSEELLGISVTESTIRVYPHGETAAHIIGYLQRSATEEMVNEKGYSYNDFVGVSGVEYTFEEYLTGASKDRHGARVIKVNRNGSEIALVSVTPAKNGNDVMLTIDLPLQKKVDEALEELIWKINEKERKIIEENEDGKYTHIVDGEEVYKDIQLAETGAIVVLDVNTGNVLAMSSYPSFDPNWFIKGLTKEQAELLMTSEYAQKTTPMRNKAVSARLAPGSIFKIVTGLAGLMEGKITLDETIDDKSPYYLYDAEGNPITSNAPSCWVSDPHRHANQTIVDAIKNSCNYYFFEVANRLGIDKLNEWAGMFGLTTATGIEVTGEAVGIIGGQKVWYDNMLPLEQQQTSMPRFVYNKLRASLERYVKSYSAGTTLNAESEEIKEAAIRLMQLQDGDVSGKGPKVREILNQYLGIPESIIKQTWVTEILSDLVELKWKDSQTIRTGIGQGSTLITPVAMARCLATIANGGNVYDVHIVDSVLDASGNTIFKNEPKLLNRIDAPMEYWEAVREGMKGVVSPEDRGTAASSWTKEFVDAGYASLISGKTGTAQIGATEQIDIHNTSWFITYTPREKPEIAIVVCVPHGYSGSSSSSAIEDIITYYYERKNAQAPENLTDYFSVTP
ncbi:MAG TPA: hypothetical protein GXZ61_01435 [Clostridiales bacterium]|jgi:penicillin-binding protein 2|nr:hypothetical protein [Clostridiales bacterium]